MKISGWLRYLCRNQRRHPLHRQLLLLRCAPSPQSRTPPLKYPLSPPAALEYWHPNARTFPAVGRRCPRNRLVHRSGVGARGGVYRHEIEGLVLTRLVAAKWPGRRVGAGDWHCSSLALSPTPLPQAGEGSQPVAAATMGWLLSPVHGREEGREGSFQAQHETTIRILTP